MLKLTSLNKYCTMAAPDRAEIWKCNALIIDNGNLLTLIDGNFNELELDYLTNLFGKPITTCYSTHSHLDHINNLHCLENKDIQIFSPDLDRILNSISTTEAKIIQALTQKNGQTVTDLTFTGLYYPLRSIKRMWGGLRKLYYFWELYCIQNHLEDLQNNQKEKLDDKKFVLRFQAV